VSTSDLLEAIAVTAELCGKTFSPAAARLFADDLTAYPTDQVISALARCRREVRGVMTLADVIARLDDGRPGPDEAWAQIPRDESATIVWCDEMAEAYGIAKPLLDGGEPIAARMAFREAYMRAVACARAARRATRWQISPGTYEPGRRDAIVAALAKKRITRTQAEALWPYEPLSEAGAALLAKTKLHIKRIPTGGMHDSQKIGAADD
jgi:hypothetical protein